MKNLQIKGLPLIIVFAGLAVLATFLVVIPASTGVPLASTSLFGQNGAPNDYTEAGSFNCTAFEILPTDLDVTSQGLTVVLDSATGSIITLDKDMELIETASLHWDNFPDLSTVDISALTIDDRGILVAADNDGKRLIKLRRALDGSRGWIPDGFVPLNTSAEILDVVTLNSDVVLVATSSGVIPLIDDVQVATWDIVTTSLAADQSAGIVYAAAFSDEIYGAGIQKYSLEGHLIDEWYVGTDIGPFGVDVGPTGHVFWSRGWKADRSIARTNNQGDQEFFIATEAPLDRSIYDLGRVAVGSDGSVSVIQGNDQECIARFAAS